jgi:hypothetical protein
MRISPPGQRTPYPYKPRGGYFSGGRGYYSGRGSYGRGYYPGGRYYDKPKSSSREKQEGSGKDKKRKWTDTKASEEEHPRKQLRFADKEDDEVSDETHLKRIKSSTLPYTVSESLNGGQLPVQQDSRIEVPAKKEDNNEDIVSIYNSNIGQEDDEKSPTKQIIPATTMVNIDGLIFSAIVDTGACASIISVKYINRLRMQESIKPAQRRLIDANGKQIPLLGTIVLPVLFGKTIRNWSFWVADNPDTLYWEMTY